jgi:hypothetical protein
VYQGVATRNDAITGEILIHWSGALLNFALTEFSEVRGYNPPRFVPVLPADASPCLPRCPGSGLLDMYVTRIRYEPLQLATGRTSENLLVGEVRIPPVRYRKGSP